MNKIRVRRRIALYVYQYGEQFRVLIPINGQTRYFGQRSDVGDAIKVRDDILDLMKERGVHIGRRKVDPLDRAEKLLQTIAEDPNGTD